jgi:hypothetical protein
MILKTATLVTRAWEVALAKLTLLSRGSDIDRHVVFVHGLRWTNTKVWMSSGNRPEVWPRWLATEIDKETWLRNDHPEVRPWMMLPKAVPG